MTDTQKTNPQNERLVAYLDGELSAPQSEAVEEQLANDAELRDELSQLDRVWNLLDLAPRSTVGSKFADSTVAMVAVEAQRHVEAQTIALPVVRKRRGWITTLTALAAALVAFVAVRGVALHDDRQLLINLPVIQQAAVLSQIDNLAFLRQVRDELPKVVTATQRLGLTQEAQTWEWLAEASIHERAKWIEKMSPEERENLAANATAFRALSPHNDRRLHNLDDELATAEDVSELRVTALAYHALVSTQSAGEQAVLRSLPPEERIKELRRKARYWSEQALIKLSDAEQAHFREAVLELAAMPSVKAVATRVSERLSDQNWRHAKNLGKQLRQHPEEIFLVLANVMARERHMTNRFADLPQFKQLADLWPSWEAKLMEGLPERVRDWMKGLPPHHRSRLLRTQLLKSAAPARPGDTMQFFAELPGEEQQVLLALPASQMQQQLREQMSEKGTGLQQMDKMWGGNLDRHRGQRLGPGPPIHRQQGRGPTLGRRPPH